MKNVTNVIPSTKPSIKAEGLLKGDGKGGVSAAVPGVDYLDKSVAPSIGANGNWFVGTEDTGIPAKAQSNTTIATITLLASEWVDNQQTAACIGVSADESKQNINISPALAQEDVYQDAGVTCVGFAEDMLTFATESIPAEDLTVYVAIEQTGGSSAANNVYSTEETVVGTWIDGKPIYRRTFITTLIAGNLILTSDKNGGELVSAYGYMLNTSDGGRNSIPFGSSASNFCVTKILDGNLAVMAGSGYAGRSCTATFEYTKTTDTATVAIPSATALIEAYEEGVNET